MAHDYYQRDRNGFTYLARRGRRVFLHIGFGHRTKKSRPTRAELNAMGSDPWLDEPWTQVEEEALVFAYKELTK